MRVTELKDRQVIDPTTARKRGRVVDVVIDPTTNRLLGVVIAPDGEASAEQISANLIARIGPHAVMLRDQGDQDTTEVGANREGYFLDYTSLVGLHVLDDGGNHVGHLNDAKIDPDSLAITAYALADTGWRHWLGFQSEIGPSEVMSWSRELMLIKPRGATGAVAGPVSVDGQQQPVELPTEPVDEPQNHTPAESTGSVDGARPTRRRRGANREVPPDFRDQES